MKTLRISLATGALLLAFSASFSSTLNNIYYCWKPATSTSPPQCKPKNVPFQCATVPNSTPCTILCGEDLCHLRETDVVANQCGASLYKVQ
jgi:hypothetical protein